MSREKLEEIVTLSWIGRNRGATRHEESRGQLLHVFILTNEKIKLFINWSAMRSRTCVEPRPGFRSKVRLTPGNAVGLLIHAAELPRLRGCSQAKTAKPLR